MEWRGSWQVVHHQEHWFCVTSKAVRNWELFSFCFEHFPFRVQPAADDPLILIFIWSITHLNICKSFPWEGKKWNTTYFPLTLAISCSLWCLLHVSILFRSSCIGVHVFKKMLNLFIPGPFRKYILFLKCRMIKHTLQHPSAFRGSSETRREVPPSFFELGCKPIVGWRS